MKSYRKWLGILGMVLALGLVLIGCGDGADNGSGGGTAPLTLKSGMTEREMLNCTAGYLTISYSQWHALQNLASFSLYSSSGSGGSFQSAFIQAFPTYLEVVVTTTERVLSLTISHMSRYRHYR